MMSLRFLVGYENLYTLLTMRCLRVPTTQHDGAQRREHVVVSDIVVCVECLLVALSLSLA